MDQPQDDEELLKKLRTHRKNILLALHRKGELATRELREESGFPAGSRNHHLGLLEKWELIEVIGRVGDENERVFHLTDRGVSFVEEVLKAEVSEDLEMRVEQLSRQVNSLEQLEERLETVQRENRVLEERFEKLKDHIAENTN